MEQLLDLDDPDRVSLALALQEKKRRETEDGVIRYTPHAKQLPFHKSTKKIRAIFGGNRSGKSVAGCAEGAWWATGLHPYRHIPVPNFGRVCTIDLSVYLEGIIIPQYKRWIPRRYLKGGTWENAYKKDYRILYLENNSTIEFMSYDQDAEKFGGSSRHWVHEDEECPSDRHHENMMRLVDTGGSCWITMTPLKGMTWVYEEIYEKSPSELIDSFAIDIFDNPHLDPKEINDILSTFPPDELDARKYGRFIKLSGLVYRFNKDIHIVQPFDIPKSWPVFAGIDPHPRKADAVLWATISPNDEIFVCDELKDDSLNTIEAVVMAIKHKERNYHILSRVIDTSAHTPDKLAHGEDVRRAFERLGIRTRLATKDKDAGINAVAQLLEPQEVRHHKDKRPRLFVFANCVKTIREITHYIWDDYRGPNPDYMDQKQMPIKKNDDLMDCLRYIVMSNPSFEPPKVYRPSRQTVCSATGY